MESEKISKAKIIEEGSIRIRKGEEKLNELLKEKTQLTAQKNAKRKAIKQLEANLRQQAEQSDSQLRQEIKKMREDMNTQTAYTNKEITEKILPESTHIESSIVESKD